MAVSDFEFNHPGFSADSFCMQSIIQDQHVAKRQRGLRSKAESIRMSLDMQLKNQVQKPSWRFMENLESPSIMDDKRSNLQSIHLEQVPSSLSNISGARFIWKSRLARLFTKYRGLRRKTNNHSNHDTLISKNVITSWEEQLIENQKIIFSLHQAPFLVGLLYFFILIFAFHNQVSQELLSRTSMSFSSTIELPQLSMMRELRTYGAYQGDQGLSFIDFQSIDSSRFQKMTTTEYIVRSGDTLSGIALRFGLNMDTIISFNNIPDVRRMQVGQRLMIPSRDGLRYQVQRGDSLESIAQRNSTTVNALLDANDLSTDVISVGTSLFIPNARLSSLDLAFAIGEVFAYPTVGRFTSGFGFRPDPFTGQRRFHNGIDLANAIGTPIRASMAGRVVHIESQVGNYGKFIILQHARGYQTLYAHLDSFAVSVGQYVNQGQLIARMGNTGRSTGPHLHFSIIQNGNFIDPLRYLRRQ